MYICHEPLPIDRKIDPCLNAIHFPSLKRNVADACPLEKTGTDENVFLYIRQNHYAYSVSKAQSELIISCPNTARDTRYPIKLSNTGSFRYPSSCSAILESRYMFLDTSLERFGQLLIPANQTIKFERIVEKLLTRYQLRDPGFAPVIAIEGAKETSVTENLEAMFTRIVTKQNAQQMQQVTQQSQSTTNWIHVLNQILVGISVFLFTIIAPLTYTFICRKLPQKRTFHRLAILKPLIRKKKDKIKAKTSEDTNETAMSILDDQQQLNRLQQAEQLDESLRQNLDQRHLHRWGAHHLSDMAHRLARHTHAHPHDTIQPVQVHNESNL
jgi:hypothetical protein